MICVLLCFGMLFSPYTWLIRIHLTCCFASCSTHTASFMSSMDWPEYEICTMAYFALQPLLLKWCLNWPNCRAPNRMCMQRIWAPPPNTVDYLKYSLEIGMHYLVIRKRPCDSYANCRSAFCKSMSKSRCKWISSYPNRLWIEIVAIHVLSARSIDSPSKNRYTPMLIDLCCCCCRCCCYFAIAGSHRPLHTWPLHSAANQIHFQSSSQMHYALNPNQIIFFHYLFRFRNSFSTFFHLC